jgi:autotransporter-associated beta strand protein
MPVALAAPNATATADFVTTDGWTENGITWNSKPPGTTVLNTTNVWQATPLKFNVGSQVNSTIAGDDILSLRTYSNIVTSGVNQYAAREWADAWLRPMLVLKNLGPQITSILNVAGNVNSTTAPQWFGVWDAETAAGSLTVSATSSNTTLLPNANIAFGGGGLDRNFTLTPAAGQFGSSTVTVTVTDAQGQTASAVFQYNVVNSVALDGDQSAPNQNDVFKVIRNGAFLDIFRNDMGTPIVHVDYASAAAYTIQALGGADQVLIDLSGGNPIPAVGLRIDGGTGNDIVSVIGSSGADSVTLQDGNLVFGASTAEILAGAEELHLNLGAGADTLVAGGNASVSAGVVKLNVAGGGSVSMGAASTLPDFTDLSVSGGATFNLNGQSQSIDELSGSGGTVTNNGGATATLTVGSAGSSSSFAGNLTDGSAALGLSKVGAGTLTLSGTNDYGALTTIAGGTISAGAAASFGGLNGQVRFDGGTFRVTGNITVPNLTNKFTTSFTGATGASTATFDVDAGFTLTIGGANASMQTNGGGAHGGRFTKTGLGTLRVLGNNGQLDDPFNFNQGTVIIESATALGGADNANNRVEMKSGTTLVLRQNTSTNFLTPISVVDAGSVVNVVIDRQTAGAGVTHSLNALSSAGAFTLVVTRGANITSGAGNFTLDALTMGGNGTFNVGTDALVTNTTTFGGAFGLTKSGAGTLVLSGANSYTGVTNLNNGVIVLNGSLTTSAAVNVTAGLLQVTPNKMRVIRTPILSVTGAGRIDLTDNKLIVAGGAASIGSAGGDGTYSGVTRLIQTGSNFGAWDGPGLVTSQGDALNGLTTLGIATADNANYVGLTFGGVSVEAGDLLVMYTYVGDADLNGYIDAVDYGAIDNWVQFPGAFGYFNGDFNYDGIIDAADYGGIDNSIQLQGPPIPV